MFSRQCGRFFHFNNNLLWSLINKSDLSKLRKKTGYTFANCKKALEANNHNVELAEKWLQEQAQALGWAKATKLEGRSTLQGLIGVSLKGDTALMVEANCETDFVARNRKFEALVELAVQSCSAFAQSLNPMDTKVRIFMLDSAQMRCITANDGKPLVDHVAMAISSLGENLNLRRAIFLKSSGTTQLAGFTHPSPKNPDPATLMGKYGALVSYRASSHDSQIQEVAKQICQHIVGMNPVKIGVSGTDEPVENKDEETVMLHQDFLLDPSVTVGQLLTDMGIEIVDFVRFECGEPLNAEEENEPVKVSSQSC
ncbi:hypothetical protein AAG570_001784 [Ranatra chinensis]|uniref:Elongation factor Ts, mitochondrial n=1 Tax=Ranatra chinensis TaxID=642074 RepID=A0ABD0YAD5_9HEMI